MRQMPDSLLPKQHEGKNQGCDEIFRAQDDLLPSDPGVPALDRVQRKDVRNAILPGIANGTAPGAAHPQGTLSGCRNAGDAGAAACIGDPKSESPGFTRDSCLGHAPFTSRDAVRIEPSSATDSPFVRSAARHSGAQQRKKMLDGHIPLRPVPHGTLEIHQVPDSPALAHLPDVTAFVQIADDDPDASLRDPHLMGNLPGGDPRMVKKEGQNGCVVRDEGPRLPVIAFTAALFALTVRHGTFFA